MWSVPWGRTFPAQPDYMPSSPEKHRAAARRIRDDFRHKRRCDIDRRRSRGCNPIFDPRVNQCGDYQEGPVTQYFVLQISVANVRTFSFLSVTSVSR